jgi:ASC-1-like (ASCH) protein
MKRILTQHKEKEPFERILKEKKKLEIRLYDKKRKKIKLGQIIKILERGSNRHLFIKVMGLSRFPNFNTLFSILKDKTNSSDKKILEKIYSKSKEIKYGVLAIHFELIKPKK